MVVVWWRLGVGAAPCVCPQRRPATIRTDSETLHHDEAINRSLLKKMDISM